MSGVVKYLKMSLLEIYRWVCRRKNRENRLICGKVMGKSSVQLASTMIWLQPVATPGGKGGSSPLWVDVQKLCNMCVHCSKCVSFWGTSYSRPPIDPYVTPPLLQNPGGATVYNCACVEYHSTTSLHSCCERMLLLLVLEVDCRCAEVISRARCHHQQTVIS